MHSMLTRGLSQRSTASRAALLSSTAFFCVRWLFTAAADRDVVLVVEQLWLLVLLCIAVAISGEIPLFIAFRPCFCQRLAPVHFLYTLKRN